MDNVGQHRWTFGVKYDAKGFPTFKAILLPDGSYDLLTPQMNAPVRHFALAKDFSKAPDGGTLMTFYVANRD